jgi:hypothetical protein
MVELEFSGLLSMWEQSSVMAAPGALCAALYEETTCICTSLPQRMNQPLETRWRNGERSIFNLEAGTTENTTKEDVVKGYVSTGRTFTTRNPAGRCTRTETSLG